MKISMLLRPHANVRYDESVSTLALCELNAAGVTDVTVNSVGGMSFLCFEAEEEKINIIRQSPNCLGLFVDTGKALLPIEAQKRHDVGAQMAQLLKYSGKTNADFTDTMLQLCSLYAKKEVHTLLDPCCARGTTLFAAADRGWDAWGTDTDKKDVAEGMRFAKKYMENARFKHRTSERKLTAEGKVGGVETRIDYRITPEGEERTLAMVCGDTLLSRYFFKGKTFDAIVADLPYGVQHSARDGATALVRAALPVWKDLLADGGVICLSYNTYTTKRENLAALADGLEVLDVSAPHWVEQAVRRDFIILRK